MSATIIAFPTKRPALENCSTRYSIDLSPVDKRGFVILDACVPLSLAVECSELLSLYREKETAPVRSGVRAHPYPMFSCDMKQLEPRGRRVLVANHLGLAVLFFFYFYPVWTGLPISGPAYFLGPDTPPWGPKTWFANCRNDLLPSQPQLFCWN